MIERKEEMIGRREIGKMRCKYDREERRDENVIERKDDMKKRLR